MKENSRNLDLLLSCATDLRLTAKKHSVILELGTFGHILVTAASFLHLLEDLECLLMHEPVINR